MSEKADKPRRRSWQFSLRTLLLAALPVALVLGLWQAKRQWRAAHYVQVETSGGKLPATAGQLTCDLVVKLRCSRPFECNIQHAGSGHGPRGERQRAITCQSRKIGSRFSDRYGVNLRIRCRDLEVSVFSNTTGKGTPVFRRDMAIPGLQPSNLVVRGQGESSLALDTPIRALCLQSHYEDPKGDLSGSASDELVIRCMPAE